MILLSDEDTLPPGERNIFVDVNSIASSLGYVCAEDLERLEHHSPLTIDYQCNEISGAELENSSVTNNTTLESLHCDVTAEGPFHLIPGQANER